MGLGVGGTICSGMAFHGGTDGEFSSEVAADGDADVRAGVVKFYKKNSWSGTKNN